MSFQSIPIDFQGVSADTVAALEEIVRQEWELEAMKAQRVQLRLAACLPEHNAIDGVGYVRRHVSSFAYHDWARKLGTYECWGDRGFNHYIDKIAPETVVRSKGTKMQLGYQAPALVAPPAPGNKRFTKIYRKEEPACS
jgi:hypothetical protein